MTQDDPIAWRLDPQISYSDWIMEVTRMAPPDFPLAPTKQQATKKDMYHVHKTFLSCGPRKSCYFYGLFHSNHRKDTGTGHGTISTIMESSSNITRISLENSVADAVPLFLDYVYGGSLKLSAESAVALHYLSDYFGVEPLKQEVFDFVRKEMLPKNATFKQRARRLLLKDKPSNDIVEEYEEDYNKENEDTDSMVLESCMKSATRWNLVRDRLLSPHSDRAGLVELVTQMLTLEQKNLLFFYALREQSNGRHRRNNNHYNPMMEHQEWMVQNQQQLELEAQEMIRIQQELVALKEEVETLKNQNEACSHAFVSLKQENEKLVSKNQLLEEQACEMDRLREDVASLKAKNEEQEQERLGLQTKIDKLERDKSSLKKEMETQSSKMSVLYSSTERLERKLTKAKKRNQTMVVNKEELDRLKEGHLTEVSRIKADSSKVIYQLQVEAGRWRDDSLKLKRQCELLEELYWSTGNGR